MLLSAENQTCELTRVPSGSFFDVIQSTDVGVATNEEGAVILEDISYEDLQLFCEILNHPNLLESFCIGTVKITNIQCNKLESLFDKYIIDVNTISGWDYIRAMIREEHMRDNMYNEGFTEHKMNTDPYYNLHSIQIFNDEGEIVNFQRIKEQFAKLFGTDFVQHLQDYEFNVENELDLGFEDSGDSGESGESGDSGDSDESYEESYEDHEEAEEEYEDSDEDSDENSESDDLLFPQTRTRLQDIPNIITSLHNMRTYTHIPGVMLAGGYIFSALFGTHSSDFDLFLTELHTSPGLLAPVKTSTTNKTLVNRIRSIALKYKNTSSKARGWYNHRHGREIQGAEIVDDLKYNVLYSRTENAITMNNGGLNTYKGRENIYCQVILRLYETYSEVLHGFDVDSCCLGFDGKNILFTERAILAIRDKINRVNFNRLSPSYEYRLAKYAHRGIRIYVPGFSRDQSEYLEKKDDLDKFVFYIRCSHKAWQTSKGIGDIIYRSPYNAGRWGFKNIPDAPKDLKDLKDSNPSEIPENSDTIRELETMRDAIGMEIGKLLSVMSETDIHFAHIIRHYDGMKKQINAYMDEIAKNSTQNGPNGYSVKIKIYQNEDLTSEKPMDVFEKWKSSHEQLKDFDKPFYDALDRNAHAVYRKLHKNVFGFNRLLVLERLHKKKRPDRGTGSSAFTALTKEHSDYNPYIPFSEMRGETFKGGQRIDLLCQYLLSQKSQEKYPEEYFKYRDLVNAMTTRWEQLNRRTNLTHCHVSVNNFLCNPRKEVLTYNSLDINDILNPIDPQIYELIELLGGTWKVPREIGFKRINPGEQTTSTFHRIVLENPDTWFNGPFYSRT